MKAPRESIVNFGIIKKLKLLVSEKGHSMGIFCKRGELDKEHPK